MSDPDLYLRHLLAAHVDCSVVCDRYCSCGVQHPDGYAAHLAEVIDQFLLVVPRGEVDGIEYGYQFRGEDHVRGGASKRRALSMARFPEVQALQRPVLAWTPLPEEAAGE